MLTATTLLRLYPRHWRDKYGDEFLATAGGERLPLRQAVDIIGGALDARFSSEVREATSAAAPSTEGATVAKVSSLCSRNDVRYTTRDGVIGATVMVIASLLFVLLGLVAKSTGRATIASMVNDLGFIAALMLSMPFWIMKGQSRRAQAIVIVGTLAALTAVSYFNG